jgi:hypothetical protein
MMHASRERPCRVSRQPVAGEVLGERRAQLGWEGCWALAHRACVVFTVGAVPVGIGGVGDWALRFAPGVGRLGV